MSKQHIHLNVCKDLKYWLMLVSLSIQTVNLCSLAIRKCIFATSNQPMKYILGYTQTALFFLVG